MYQRNLFLIQIEHANRLIESSWPQERRLGLILLENIFEIFIKRKVENIFELERPGWDEKRSLSSRKKKNILRFYPDLLTFAVQRKVITAEEKAILLFVHDLRNKNYHTSYAVDEELVEIAIQISCTLIRDNPIRWVSAGYFGYAMSKGFENRYFSSNSSFHSDKEIPAVVAKLLKYGAKKRTSPNNLLENILAKEVEKIRENIGTIKAAFKDIDYNFLFFAHGDISNIRISDLDQLPIEKKLLVVLIFYDCATSLKDELNDIDERSVRYAKFEKVFKEKIKSRPAYPLEAIKNFNKRKLKFNQLKFFEALEITQNNLRDFEALGRAAADAANCFHEYVQHEIDRIRGK